MHSRTLTSHLPDFDRAGVLFSGGADSAALLFLLSRHIELERLVALHADTPLAEGWERTACEHVCANLGVQLIVTKVDTLAVEGVRMNSRMRCYACKSEIAAALLAEGRCAEVDIFLEGTTAQEAAGDRPGMRALAESGIYSPFTKFDISRNEIREYAIAAGLAPGVRSGSCMATRLPTDMPLNVTHMNRLRFIERKFRETGFRLVRARLQNDHLTVLVQTGSDEHDRLSDDCELLQELSDATPYSVKKHPKPYEGIQ